MFQIWSYTTAMKAKYATSSKIHTMLDLTSNLLLVFSAMGISPTRGFYRDENGAQLNATDGLAPGSGGAAVSTGSGSGSGVDTTADADALAFVIYPLLLALGLWICRFAELALFARREAARRENRQELLIGLQVLCMWGGAAVLSSQDNDEMDDAHAARADQAAALLWCGNLWWAGTRALVPVLPLLRSVGKRTPVERSLVCPHHGYNYHRTNEFMFLMLGESVLQIVIAAGPRSEAPPGEQRQHWYVYTRATAFGGFVLAVCMMHTFRAIVNEQLQGRHELNETLSERHKEEQQMMSTIEKDTETLESTAMEYGSGAIERRASGAGFSRRETDKRRMRRCSMIATMNKKQMAAIRTEKQAQRSVRIWLAVSATELFLWQWNAIAVLLVGAALKIAVYNPLEWAPGRFGAQQRYLLAVPVAGQNLIQMVYRLFIKNHHYYHSFSQFRKFPAHMCIIAGRVVLLVTSVAVCSVEYSPLVHVWMQATIMVLHVVLLHAMKISFPIRSDKEHSLDSIIDKSFDALRLKALRHRNRQSFAVPGFSPDSKPRPTLARRLSHTLSPTIARRISQQLEGVVSSAAPEAPAPVGPRARWMRNSKETELKMGAAKSSGAPAAARSPGLSSRWMRDSKESLCLGEASERGESLDKGPDPLRWSKRSSREVELARELSRVGTANSSERGSSTSTPVVDLCDDGLPGTVEDQSRGNASDFKLEDL